jgi:hypothetical protein
VRARGYVNSRVGTAGGERCRLARSDAPRGRYLKVHSGKGGDVRRRSGGRRRRFAVGLVVLPVHKKSCAHAGHSTLARGTFHTCMTTGRASAHLRTRGSQHTCAWHVSQNTKAKLSPTRTHTLREFSISNSSVRGATIVERPLSI